VAEVSLDFDVDLMVSDLAPMDRVIQRAGRIWRHARSGRSVPSPRLLLLSPEPVADPPANWLGAALRRTGYIYGDHALLRRSARALLREGAIVTPDNIRALVEEAFDATAEDAIPARLQPSALKAEGKDLGDGAVARLNLLIFGKPYDHDTGAWAADILTPTRLGEKQITLRLAKVVDGALQPWCDAPTPALAWALSEVSVRASLMQGAVPTEYPLTEKAKQNWPEWERGMPLMILRQHGSVFSASLYTDDKKEIVVSYDTRIGLTTHLADRAHPALE
jgi:CRISPR-associated endonuclease/helicase Cas3